MTKGAAWSQLNRKRSFPFFNEDGASYLHLRQTQAYKAVQRNCKYRENENGGEHQIHFHSPISQQHQIAKPVRGPHPLARDCTNGRINSGGSQRSIE